MEIVYNSGCSLHCLLLSCINVFSSDLKVGCLILMICCWIFSEIHMIWFIDGEVMEQKADFLSDRMKIWFKLWEKLFGREWRIYHYHQYIESKKVRKNWCRNVLVAWMLTSILGSLSIFWYLNSLTVEKRKETLASMCDERARMLQDQFNVSMNHVQALSILVSTFHHAKNPSAIDQVLQFPFVLMLFNLFSFFVFFFFHLSYKLKCF